MPVTENFVQARARLHEARRAERLLAFDLMVEFLKATQGEVSGAQVGALFKKWKIPYPSELYLNAREKAGLPLQKVLDRHGSAPSKLRKLEETFREVYETTPEARRPKAVTPLDQEVMKRESVRGLVTQRAAPAEEWKPTLRAFSTQDLLDELKRRRAEAEEIMKLVPPTENKE